MQRNNDVKQVENEVRVFTQTLNKLINNLKQIRQGNKQHQSELAEKANDYQAKINNLINLIEDDLSQNNQTKVTNIYFNYFLQKVAQYNSLFFIVHESSQKPASPEVDSLLLLDYKPIKHELLGSANSTIIRYEVKTDPDANFREAFVADHDGKDRYFYHKDDVNNYLGKKNNSFIEHYKKANVAIGAFTQVSNVKGGVKGIFNSIIWSQQADSYWRAKDLSPHEQEKVIFKGALDKLDSGEELNDEEMNVLQSGNFYRGTGSSLEFSLKSTSTQHDQKKMKHTHIGHATEVIDQDTAVIVVDPINYHCASKVFYDRNTQPGNHASNYFSHITTYSHNHYDHADEQTYKEAWKGLTPLVIVPAGDEKLLKSWGAENIVEISSWNQVVSVTLTNAQGEENTLNIHALPARHASNREKGASMFDIKTSLYDAIMPDINTSLYMGFMYHNVNTNHMTLVNGDTGVLDSEHMLQLEAFAVAKDITLDSAFLQAGPDRPRSLMECSHQSSADSVALHAALNVINAKIMARRRVASEKNCDVKSISLDDVTVTKEDFKKAACSGIGYHQGCFRLGVLNYSDVEGTFTRMLAVLDAYKDEKLSFVLNNLSEQKGILDALQHGVDISDDEYKKLQNYPFAIMDNFERVGLINTLQNYQRLFSDNGIEYTATEMKDFISRHTYLPKPGQTMNFNEANPHFTYDYQRLIVNRDPTGQISRAYNDIIAYMFENRARLDALLHDLSPGAKINGRSLLKVLVKHFYLQRPAHRGKSKAKHDILNNIFDKLSTAGDNTDVIKDIIYLRGKATSWATSDESKRDEGHLETTLLVAYGLMTDDSFKKQFLADYNQYAASKLAAPSPSPGK